MKGIHTRHSLSLQFSIFHCFQTCLIPPRLIDHHQPLLHSPRSTSAEIALKASLVPKNISELTHKLQSLVNQAALRKGRDYVDQVSRILLERNAAVGQAAWASLCSVLHNAENTTNLCSSNAPVPPAPSIPVAPALVSSSVPESLLAVPHFTELTAHLRQTWELSQPSQAQSS
ncbi:hypothetical protein K435DRAFT_861931 [Dendrothele bispora CBS 962.96]|uniref:Uncharacterized protein n=1 Tax=Dendrothele bispora (strain CBS 962.96) TaxID=1314807 RepID=A0A4S8LU24_DENBC|nr:hypothetical protein K435DRAFT_861931 [Dendrothele bispora CBS 962.96]